MQWTNTRDTLPKLGQNVVIKYFNKDDCSFEQRATACYACAILVNIIIRDDDGHSILDANGQRIIKRMFRIGDAMIPSVSPGRETLWIGIKDIEEACHG